MENKLHKTAKIWGTDDFGGFGFLNFVFEGLVSGDKYGTIKRREVSFLAFSL